MPLQSTLASPFERWAVPKLRALANARASDAALLTRTGSLFQQLLDRYMAEYEDQPFAHPDVDGDAAAAAIAIDVLREGAKSFFVTNTRPGGLSLLAAYEAKDSIRSGLFVLAATAYELWASTEPVHIRLLTCVELGIPPPDDDAQLPADFARRRAVIVEREFHKLLEAERAQWYELEHELTVAMARGEITALDIQNRQASVSRWMRDTLQERFAANPLGELVIQWQGFYVGEETKTVQRFRGHMSTVDGEDEACWFESSGYLEEAAPPWRNFINEQVKELVVFPLGELYPDTCSEQLAKLREKLEFFLEELFRLQCGLNNIDRPVFWARIQRHPYHFVAANRLPNGIPLGSPIKMPEEKFRIVYNHIWQCQVHRDSVDPMARFGFEAKMVNEYIALHRADQLKAAWDDRKRNAAAAVPSAMAHASAVQEQNKNATTVAPATIPNALAAGEQEKPNAASVDGHVIDMVDAKVQAPTSAGSMPLLNTALIQASPGLRALSSAAHGRDARGAAGTVIGAVHPPPAKHTIDGPAGQLVKAARHSSIEDVTARRAPSAEDG